MDAYAMIKLILTLDIQVVIEGIRIIDKGEESSHNQ